MTSYSKQCERLKELCRAALSPERHDNANLESVDWNNARFHEVTARNADWYYAFMKAANPQFVAELLRRQDVALKALRKLDEPIGDMNEHFIQRRVAREAIAEIEKPMESGEQK